MEDLSEFLGWANVSLFVAVILVGLLLRFGGLKQSRPQVAMAHRILSVVALFSLFGHFLLVEQRPWYLIAAGGLLVLLPLFTVILKRMKRLKLAINLKLVVIPIVAAIVLIGHLSVGENDEEGGSSGERYETSDD